MVCDVAESGEAWGRDAERAGGRVRGRRRRRGVHGDEGRVGAEDAGERVVGAVGARLRRRQGKSKQETFLR